MSWDTVKRKIEGKATIHSPKKKEIALSENERKSMEETALHEEKVSSLLCILATYTGLRIGEIATLTWKDVNLEEAVLNITKTVNKYYIRDKHGNRLKHVYDIGATKTEHSTREIPLTDKAILII